jgi:RNA polymerase-binding transcription factor DksA
MKTQSEPINRTRYSDEELAEFDALLIEKLAVAKEQLSFYEKQIQELGETESGKIPSIDDGTASYESERLQNMAARQKSLLQHLENARLRVKNKVYGICRESGLLISKERLRAVPHATLSIEAKQKRN